MLLNKHQSTKKGTEILWNVRTISQRTDEILNHVKDSGDTKKRFVTEVEELASMNRSLMSMLEEQNDKLNEHGFKIDKLHQSIGELMKMHEPAPQKSFSSYFTALWSWMSPNQLEMKKSEEQMNMIARAGMFTYLF